LEKRSDRSSTDVVSHVTAAGGKLRGLAALTTQTVDEARRRHGTHPTATAALGRTITATAMLAAGLKNDDKVMTEIVGDGPLKGIVAEVNAHGHVRGYVHNPFVHLPLNAKGKLDVKGAVGKGRFCVTKDLGLREPYRGVVPLISGEIAEDFAYYLHQSEQTPAASALGVLVDPDNSVRAAGGILIQLLPGAASDTQLVLELERRMESLPMLSRAIDNGIRPLDLLYGVLEGLGPELLEERPLYFRCSCSKERFARGLVALGEKELRDIVESDGAAELVCHFCSETYEFTREELLALADEARSQGASPPGR